MQITGKLIKVGEVKEFGVTKYKKREIVVETYDRFPQKILIELGGDKTVLSDVYNVGDSITVFINISGRDWTSPEGEVKYFNTIQGWKIDRASSEGEGNQVEAPLETQDDLPF